MRHFSGARDPFTARRDVDWLDELGEPMSHHKWHEPSRKFFAAMLDMGRRGVLLLIFNASAGTVEFPLPKGRWRRKFDTALDSSFAVDGDPVPRGEPFASAPRSVACLMLCSDNP